MFARRKSLKRFTLLLLEEEEDYVQDWVAECRWPKGISGNWQHLEVLPGKLRLCTKSVFFEPDDVRTPIVRIAFAHVQELEGRGSTGLSIITNQVTKMRANMAEVPYISERATPPAAWGFTLLYAPMASCLSQAQQLWDVAKLPKMERSRKLEALVRAQEDAAAFDTSRLVDFSERLLWRGAVTLLTPLVKERGQLVLTGQRVYFQPLHNVAGDAPVRSQPLAYIAAVARRRSSLRPIGLELFFIETGPTAGTGPVWDAPSAFFAFRSEQEREAVAQLLSSQSELGRAIPNPAGASAIMAAGSLLEARGAWLRRVTAAWQQAKISNFDYLLYLNFAAGRSFNDLAQWPVFPWVLSNYVSQALDLNDPSNFRDLAKPIGAINPSRLDDFRRRFREMPTDTLEGGMPPFLYGTHYSTPGYVMYWLVRAAPSHMLRLQNGRFDAPDRTFASIQESWESVLTSSTDVKELIPEFFLPNGDFLVNAQHLPLGVRQSGQAVEDVQLPPWAQSPLEFLAKHRAALESPCVSCQLNHWIDLVFGYKQTGPAAEEADNVFYYLTYEGAVDTSSVTDPVELKALEVQVNEFGQTPKQLFTQPHPPRLVCPPPPEPASVFTGVDLSPATGVAPARVSLRGTSTNQEDAGTRALALALLGTILAAAAPEFSNITSETAAVPGAAVLDASNTMPASSGASQTASLVANQLANTISQPSTTTIRSVSGTTTVAITAADGVNVGCGSYAGLASLSSGFQAHSGAPEYDVRMQEQPPALSTSSVPQTALQIPSNSQQVMPPLSSAQQPPTLTEQPSTGVAQPSPSLINPQSPADHPSTTATASEPPQVASRSASGALATPVPTPSRTPSGMLSFLKLSRYQRGSSPTSPEPSNATSPTPAAAPADPQSAGAQQSVAEAVHHAGLPGTDTAHASQVKPSPQPSLQSASARAGQESASEALPQTMLPGISISPLILSQPASQTHGQSVPAHPHSIPVHARQSHSWSRRITDGLHVIHSSRLQKDTLNAVALWPTDASSTSISNDISQDHSNGNGTSVNCYCAGSAGLLRVMSSASTQPLRSATLNGDLLSLVLLPQDGSAAAKHPLMVLGSHTGSVLAYSVDQGRLTGSFQAHDDAVCCLASLRWRLLTASWDCSVKIWSTAEGRAPWCTGLSLPELDLRDFDCGVWALASSTEGQLLATGTEEGSIALWDMRVAKQTWQVSLGADYIGGLAFTPDGRFLLAASAGGSLSLLDCRRAGAKLGLLAAGSPYRACQTDGRLAVAGDELGRLHLWDVQQLVSGAVPLGPHPPGPDGVYPYWQGPEQSAITSVAVLTVGQDEGETCVAAAYESGMLCLLSAPSWP